MSHFSQDEPLEDRIRVGFEVQRLHARGPVSTREKAECRFGSQRVCVRLECRPRLQ